MYLGLVVFLSVHSLWASLHSDHPYLKKQGWPYNSQDVVRKDDIQSNNPIMKHRLFIITGGSRTLNQTEDSILRNLIYPVCAPPSCIAHLILHLSRADNRPMVDGNDDPSGSVVQVVEEANKTVAAYFSSAKDLFPDGYLVIHKVDAYEIGSEKEQAMMDEVEREMDPDVARRLLLFRRGDPRRYSMWFARAYAWRFAKVLTKLFEFDFFVFCRPDILWMMPVPSKKFFDDHSPNKTSTVWVHSTYYSDTPDTFAFLPSFEAADAYFSLTHLVKEGVACLGGPNFNQSLVKTRLASKNIETVDSDWCSKDLGWSEDILSWKLQRCQIEKRYLNAAATILRPPDILLCEPLTPGFGWWSNIEKSHLPVIACLLAQHLIRNGYTGKDCYLPPKRLLGRNKETRPQCLTWNDTSSMLQPMQCEESPHPPAQLFAQDHEGKWFRYFANVTAYRYDIIPLSSENQKILSSGFWEAENVQLYSTESYRLISQ